MESPIISILMPSSFLFNQGIKSTASLLSCSCAAYLQEGSENGYLAWCQKTVAACNVSHLSLNVVLQRYVSIDFILRPCIVARWLGMLIQVWYTLPICSSNLACRDLGQRLNMRQLGELHCRAVMHVSLLCQQVLVELYLPVGSASGMANRVRSCCNGHCLSRINHL